MVADLLEDLDTPSALDSADLVHRLRMIEHNAIRALEIPNELKKRIGTPKESVDVNAQVEAGIAARQDPEVRPAGDGSGPWAAQHSVHRPRPGHRKPPAQCGQGDKRPAWLATCDDLAGQRLPREPFIVITVNDTGVGMTDDELNRLFEPRQPGHRGSGLGFGMMWVRGWVRRAQGLIEVESKPGLGHHREHPFPDRAADDRSNAPRELSRREGTHESSGRRGHRGMGLHAGQSRATCGRVRDCRLREPGDGQGRAAERPIRCRDSGYRPRPR